jgi:N-acetylglucosaminyldiphosphoundecaprenol N-acetyl-beta-D-mannosaminyltransferase
MDYSSTIKILGLDFHNGCVNEAITVVKSGGLLVAPAAPGLANINADSKYYNALQDASIVIADSGFMTLIWNSMNKSKVNKISGLKFLISFLNDPDIQRCENILLVDPSPAEAHANLTYLNNNGFNLGSDMSYVAPIYRNNNVIDDNLLAYIEEKKPEFIIINLGGGVQEKLGAYLFNNLTYKPGIVCTGAAIAFLTGHQAGIPAWADKFSLGWLCRCVENPGTYLPRYLRSFRLLSLMLRSNANVTA